MSRLHLAACAGVALIGALSCGDSTSPAAGPELLALPAALDAGPLLACTPSAADSATESIGPEGGTMTVGPHSLLVPPGALAAPVTITARVPADTVVSIVLGPEGLEFQHPAFLTLSYAGCGVLRTWLPKRIAYTSDDLVILEYLWSWDNLWAQRVTGRLDHFSTYAVAW